MLTKGMAQFGTSVVGCTTPLGFGQVESPFSQTLSEKFLRTDKNKNFKYKIKIIYNMNIICEPD